MDISLYSCTKSESIGSDNSLSVKPKTRKALAMRRAPAPAIRSAVSNTTPLLAGSSQSLQPNVLRVERPLQRTPSKYRWRSAPDVVIESLKGMSFTIVGSLDCLSREDVVEMIETCGGTVYKTLAKKAQYLITGSNASANIVKAANDMNKNILNESQFLDLVRDKGKELKESRDRYQKSNESSADESSDIALISSDELDFEELI